MSNKEQKYCDHTMTLGEFWDMVRFSPEMTEAIDKVILDTFDCTERAID